MPRHSVESPGVFIIDFAEKQPLSPGANLGGRKLDARRWTEQGAKSFPLLNWTVLLYNTF
jgi:hypothetical protein